MYSCLDVEIIFNRKRDEDILRYLESRDPSYFPNWCFFIVNVYVYI